MTESVKFPGTDANFETVIAEMQASIGVPPELPADLREVWNSIDDREAVTVSKSAVRALIGVMNLLPQMILRASSLVLQQMTDPQSDEVKRLAREVMKDALRADILTKAAEVVLITETIGARDGG